MTFHRQRRQASAQTYRHRQRCRGFVNIVNIFLGVRLQSLRAAPHACAPYLAIVVMTALSRNMANIDGLYSAGVRYIVRVGAQA